MGTMNGGSERIEPCPECGTPCHVERHKLHRHYEPVSSLDGISYNEDQRRGLLAFVRKIGAFEVVAWQRDGEDVVTMSRADCDKIIALFAEARRLTTDGRLPI